MRASVFRLPHGDNQIVASHEPRAGSWIHFQSDSFGCKNCMNDVYWLCMSTRCFAMCKPGVLNRRLVGQVISRLENKGLKLVGLKMMCISQELAARHYAEHFGKPFYDDLISYITSGPVVAMVWQGDDCVSLVRNIVGSTKPSEALPGTIRGDFCAHTNHNIIHASDCDESAEREIQLFFEPDELVDWNDEAGCWF